MVLPGVVVADVDGLEVVDNTVVSEIETKAWIQTAMLNLFVECFHYIHIG